jgi:hypothetical protein
MFYTDLAEPNIYMRIFASAPYEILLSAKSDANEVETLYLPGPLTQAKQRHVIGATKELLRVCKQPFVESNEVTTAGFSLWYAGYESEFKRLMEKNMDFF